MIPKPKPAKMDEFAIFAEIRRRGFNFQVMAKESGIDAKRFSAALKRPDGKANSFIAAKLGMTTHELWPHWYDPDGDLLPPKYRKRFSSAAAAKASQEMGASA